jgi:hypothetical protein
MPTTHHTSHDANRPSTNPAELCFVCVCVVGCGGCLLLVACCLLLLVVACC